MDMGLAKCDTRIININVFCYLKLRKLVDGTGV